MLAKSALKMLGLIRTVIVVRLSGSSQQLNEHRIGAVSVRVQLNGVPSGGFGQTRRDRVHNRWRVEHFDLRMVSQHSPNDIDGFLSER
jgi:hypothetical protein